MIADLGGGEKSLIIHRASLLRELIAPLPKGRLHSTKKLTKVEAITAGIQITFEDGSVDRFDVVIGADGIFSSVRNYVLQHAAKECAASPAGFVGDLMLVYCIFTLNCVDPLPLGGSIAYRIGLLN